MKNFKEALHTLIDDALKEDVGDGDHSTISCIPADAKGKAELKIKQEGILFKHVLRMILLCSEFAQLTPTEIAPEAWRMMMTEISQVLTSACRAVDPQSTDELLEELDETA